MSKIAVVTDSNSGIMNNDEIENVFVVPMPFEVDGEEFYENVNLTQEEFFVKQRAGAEIFTSQPSPQSVMDMWDEILKDYDEIVHIPMSSSLSSSYQTAMVLSDEYDGRVQVVDNQRISVTLKDSVKDALTLAAKGKSAKEIKDILEEEKLNSSIYVTVETLTHLKKGGRITPAAAALGTILKIKPVLQVHGGKLDAFAKVRTMSSAKSTMIEALKKEYDESLSCGGKYKTVFHIAQAGDLEAAEAFKEDIKEAFGADTEIDIATLPLSICCHIGPDALGFAISRVIE